MYQKPILVKYQNEKLDMKTFILCVTS